MSDIRKPQGRPYVIVDGRPYFDLPAITAVIAKMGLRLLASGPQHLEKVTTITALVEFLNAATDKAFKEIEADDAPSHDTGDRQS